MRLTCLEVAALLCAFGCGGRSSPSDVFGDTEFCGSSCDGSGGSTKDGPPPDFSADDENCGRSNHDCLGGQCVNGVCQPVVLANGPSLDPTALAVDDELVWWASPLSRVPKAGGVGETLAESREKVWGIAVDTDAVYWSSPFDTLRRFDRQTYAIREVALRGYRVALDDVFVYLVWKGVWRIPKTLDAPVPLADSGDQGIALDETFVYFSSWSPGGVHRVPKAGGPVQTLLDAGYCSYVAVFGDSVYVSVQGSPSGVYVVPKQGGTSTMIAPAAIPYGIAADSDGVYWTEWLNGKVWMLPTGDSSPIPVATGQEYPRDLAVDERAIYWTNDANTSAVSKVAKP